MKVVLLKDVKNTGRAGAVIECSDGHGANFLIPRGLAVVATPANLRVAESRAKQYAQIKELDAKLIENRLNALAEERIVIIKKANEQGHLYDGVDAAEIAKATDLPVEAIKLEKPIKDLGEFAVPVAMGASFGSIVLFIEAE
jgi:large subunit ribosomal protein L9